MGQSQGDWIERNGKEITDGRASVIRTFDEPVESGATFVELQPRPASSNRETTRVRSLMGTFLHLSLIGISALNFNPASRCIDS
jgi:hypothetical protein